MALAKELAPIAAAWELNHPAIQLSRGASMCLLAAMHCFESAAAERLDLMFNHYRFSQVLNGMDDVMDGVFAGIGTEAERLLWGSSLVGIARSGGRTLPDDPHPIRQGVANLFAASCRDTRAACTGDDAYNLFVDQVSLAMAAMACDIQLASRLKPQDTPPKYEAFLKNGSFAVLVPLWATRCLSLWPTTAQLRLSSKMMEEIACLAETAGRVVRLANDLRSLARDERMGQPNSVLLLAHETGVPMDVAEARVFEEVDRLLPAVQGLATSMSEPLRPWGRAIARVTLATVEIYLIGELHHVRFEDIESSAR